MKDGRQDKAGMMKAFGEAKCEIKSYSMSDDTMRMIGPDVAVLTFKGTQDGTCDGTKVPAAVWSSSVYVREGEKWKSLLYLENEVVDPMEALMSVEKAGWDAWVKRDAKGVESVMGKDFVYLSGMGPLDRAAALKNWSEPKCEGLEYTFSDPKAVSLTADVALVTYKADAKGKCDGKPVTPSVWVASFDMKEGDVWKNAFYTDIPR